MRHATEADLAAIVAIYNSTVPTRQSTADTQEVSVESRRERFRQHTPDRRSLLVHEIQNRIVAWVSFQSFRGRPAYDYTSEISIYIAPQYRGQGLGRQLLMEAIAMTPRIRYQDVGRFCFLAQ